MSPEPASPTAAVDSIGENPDPLLSATDAARYLGLVGVVKHPGQTVRNLIRKRQLRGSVVAGKIMTRVSWLEAYICGNEGRLARRGSKGRRRRKGQRAA